jgi:predicted dehydrogenase
VFLMEGFMYRCHPQTSKLVELIREGAIGQVRLIRAEFSFQAGFDPNSRLFNNALGGGGILDVGCYCASMARLVAGAAMGRNFADPIDIKGSGHIGESGVDDFAAALLKFPGDIFAEISAGVTVSQENVVRIFGSEGSILVPSPWFCGRGAGGSKIVVERQGEASRDVVIDTDSDLFTIEADTVAASIANRQAPSPAMTWEDTLGNMRTLDAWRTAIGLTYKGELPHDDYPTIDQRSLRCVPTMA